VSTLLQDSFTGANGTDLTAHTMNVGPGWTNLNTPVKIQGNRARPDAASGNGPYSSDAGNADVTVTLDVVVPASGNMVSGALLRASASTDFWAGYIQSDDNGATARLVISDNQSGVFTPRASQAFAAPPAGTTVTLTVVASGNSITLSANTGESCNFTSSFNNSVTKHGLFSYTDGSYVQVDVDNFLTTDSAILPPAVTSFLPTSGRVGSSVVIAGTYFTGATSVTFNGVSASFVVDSSIQITATVPVGATTGVIAVTTPDGTGASVGSFTVTATTLRIACANEVFPQGDAVTFAVPSSGSGASRKACMSRHWIGSGARSDLVLSWTCNSLSPNVGAVAVSNGGYTIIGVVVCHNGIAVQAKFSGGNTKVIASGDTDIQCDALLPAQFSVSSFARDSTVDVKEIREYADSSIAKHANVQAITTTGDDFCIAYNPAVVSVTNFVTTQNFFNDGNIVGGVFNTDFIVAGRESPIVLGRFVSGNPATVALAGDSKTQGVGDLGTSPNVGAVGLSRMLYPNAGVANNLTAGLNFGCPSGVAADWATGSSKLTTYLQYVKYGLEAYGTNNLNAAASIAIHAQMRANGLQKIIRLSLTARTTGAWTLADGTDQTLAANWGVGQLADTFEAAMRALVTTDLSYFSLDATRLNNNPANALYWKWFANGTPAFETADGVHQNTQGYEDSVGGNGNLITNSGSSVSTLRGYLATLNVTGIPPPTVVIGGAGEITWKDHVLAKFRLNELKRELYVAGKKEKTLQADKLKVEKKLAGKKSPPEGILARYWKLTEQLEEVKVQVHGLEEDYTDTLGLFRNIRLALHEDEDDDFRILFS